ERRRAVKDAIPNVVIGQRLAVGVAKDVGRDHVLGADAVGGGRRHDPLGIDPMPGDQYFAGIPGGDARCIGSDLGVAFDGRAGYAPGLAWAKHKVVVGIGVAARDGVFAVVGVADGVLVVDFVASSRKETTFVDFGDIAGPFEEPFDSPVPPRIAVF